MAKNFVIVPYYEPKACDGLWFIVGVTNKKKQKKKKSKKREKEGEKEKEKKGKKEKKETQNF